MHPAHTERISVWLMGLSISGAIRLMLSRDSHHWSHSDNRRGEKKTTRMQKSNSQQRPSWHHPPSLSVVAGGRGAVVGRLRGSLRRLVGLCGAPLSSGSLPRNSGELPLSPTTTRAACHMAGDAQSLTQSHATTPGPRHTVTGISSIYLPSILPSPFTLETLRAHGPPKKFICSPSVPKEFS